MKNNPIVCFLICSLTVFTLQSQNLKRELLYTVEPGYEIVTHENRFSLGCGIGEFCIVTKSGGVFWVIDNGKKTGPFADMFEAFSHCKGKDGNKKFSSEIPGGSYIESGYIEYSENSEVYIRHANGRYGPYDYLLSFWMSSDKKYYFAVTRQENQTFFISSLSGVTPVKGNFVQAHMSSCQSSSLIICKTGNEMMNELMSTDMSEMSEEEMQEFLNRLNEMAENQADPEVFIYTSDGGSFGPYNEQSINGPQYSISGLTNWHMIIGQTLYINGVQRYEFVDEWPSPDDIWVSSDGKRFAWMTWDQLKFSDGETYNFPLHVDYCWVHDHYQLMWICLEDQSFVRYSKDF